METRATALGKTVTYTVEANLPSVAADRVTIYEVLYNLLDNAIKYSGASDEISVIASKTKKG